MYLYIFLFIGLKLHLVDKEYKVIRFNLILERAHSPKINKILILNRLQYNNNKISQDSEDLDNISITKIQLIEYVLFKIDIIIFLFTIFKILYLSFSISLKIVLKINKCKTIFKIRFFNSLIILLYLLI
jgi:hypothetical protein